MTLLAAVPPPPAPAAAEASRVDAPRLEPPRLDGLRLGDRERASAAPAAPRRWVTAVVVTIVVAAGCAAAAWRYAAGRLPSVHVATARAPVATDAVGETLLQATGYLVARRQATVSAQITGTVTEVLFEEGDEVRKGQLLARLDGSGARAALNVAQAAIESSQAVVIQAKAQLAQSQSDLQRQTQLAASGMVSRQAVEQSHTAAATAQAQLDVRLREVDGARANYARARVDADYTQVRAPFAGVVTVKAAQVGEIVSPLSAGGFTRTGVCTIVDMDSLEVEVDVNEAAIAQVAPKMPVEAVLPAYPGWKIPGHVIALVPSADRGKATVKVRIALEQKDRRLVPEMGVGVSFLSVRPPVDRADLARAASGAIVPTAAVAVRGGGRVVFVVADGKAQARHVETDADAGGATTRVRRGVAVGDAVVVSPPPSLADGDAVTLERGPSREPSSSGDAP